MDLLRHSGGGRGFQGAELVPVAAPERHGNQRQTQHQGQDQQEGEEAACSANSTQRERGIYDDGAGTIELL